jgi:hypothetical protein
MNYILGVVINPIKGFEGNLIEFAKNWFHTKGQNLTPLGSKSLMRSIRNPLFITAVLTDYNKKDYNSILQLELSVLIKIMEKIFDKEGLQQWKWLFSILGPQGGFWRLGKDNLDVKSMEVLFREFLIHVGVPFTAVTDFYYYKLIKSSWTPLRSFRDLWISYWKLFKFLLRPNIWSNSKFKKLGTDPKYTAVLTTATVSVITIPLLILSFLRAVRLWILLWLISGFGCLFGFSYISNFVIGKVLSLRNTIRRAIHNFFLNWELVRAGQAQPSPIGINFNKPKKPINRVLNSALLFSRWMLGLKTNRPIQLLVDRVRTQQADELPAVKTAEKVLSSLNMDYNRFNRKVKSELKRIRKLKSSKNAKGRKKS